MHYYASKSTNRLLLRWTNPLIRTHHWPPTPWPIMNFVGPIILPSDHTEPTYNLPLAKILPSPSVESVYVHIPQWLTRKPYRKIIEQELAEDNVTKVIDTVIVPPP